jgi:phosphoglycolate phosphatase-like HAD superfamily hydrolase
MTTLQAVLFDWDGTLLDSAEAKPHPAALQLCLARLGISAEQAAYIGDSPEDVLMARGVRSAFGVRRLATSF